MLNKANLRDLKAATGLQSGNAQFGSKSVMFCTMWPWNLMDALGKQDRRWNADKPSAALDPYIPTWLTTSSANHRPANFWKSFFFFLKHWKEIVKSGAISCWTDVDQFQIWSSQSLILEVQIITDIIYQSIMGMLTYFHSMSLRCSYMIFSVAYLYRLLRGLISLSLYIYTYIAIYRVLALHNICAIPPAVYPEMCSGTIS